jgi:hypothetical protein
MQSSGDDVIRGVFVYDPTPRIFQPCLLYGGERHSSTFFCGGQRFQLDESIDTQYHSKLAILQSPPTSLLPQSLQS